MITETNVFEIQASDNVPVSVTRFGPEKDNGRILLICSATGVKQSFYAAFATYAAESGYTVYTFDYRGIGLSAPADLNGFEATMRDWAQKDWKTVTRYLTVKHPGSKKFLIGHSIGGSFIGLSDAHEAFDAFVTVGSQLGYWRYFDASSKPKVLWFFHVAIPLLSVIKGYFPSAVKKLGEPLPYGVAFDWKTLIIHPKSILALAGKSENHYEKIRQPMLMLSMEDDWMATRLAVDKLAGEVFVNARVERRHIEVAEGGSSSIGHMNLFRSGFKYTLWHIPLGWLAKQ